LIVTLSEDLAMESSQNVKYSLLPDECAPQHRRAPRPLPLFLEMVRAVGESDPATARAALDGLAKYERTPRQGSRPTRPVAAQVGSTRLYDFGGEGPPAILVPSLINPPHVLDLDETVSLAAAVARMGRRSLLLDWGPARDRDFDVGGHVEKLLLPLIGQLDRTPALIGYCLGGTMTIGAANLAPVERVATVASPWRFADYPAESRQSLLALWTQARATAASLKALPMEVLQGAFWSLDPARTVKKFADFSAVDPASPEARRFAVLEDWANEGEPLPFPAARELIEDFFGADLPGAGEWRIRGQAITDKISAPLLSCTAARDRIAPAESGPHGKVHEIPAGHVGMVVGSARTQLHSALASFLDPACR
jgi:polyhydroxyalkanoate synthase subunit PhaC